MTPSEAQEQAREIVDANPAEVTLSVPRAVLAELAFMPAPIEEPHFIVYAEDAPTLLYVGDGNVCHIDREGPWTGMGERTEAIVGALLDLASRRMARARFERDHDLYHVQPTT